MNVFIRHKIHLYQHFVLFHRLMIAQEVANRADELLQHTSGHFQLLISRETIVLI